MSALIRRCRVPAILLGLVLPLLRPVSAADPPSDRPVAPGVQRESVNLILIDVIVTDRKGRSVVDLRPEDFRLWVDGHPHEINSVELRESGKPEPEKAPPPVEGRPTGKAAVFPDRSSRRFVFFLDGLNCERGLGTRPIQAVRDFLKGDLLPGDEVMLAGLGRELKIYQAFTGDPAEMDKALEAMEADPDLRTAGRNRARSHMRQMQEAEELCSDCSAVQRAKASQRLAVVFADEDRRRAYYTLSALRAVATSLEATPGRKELYFLTDGFSADPDALYGSPGDPRTHGYAHSPSPGNPDGGVSLLDVPEAGIDLQTEILRTAREAGSVQVAIHTVNTQGVPHSTTMMLQGVSGRSPEELIESSASDALAELALGSGGVASRGTNDFLPALKRVEREARASYVLSYVPSGEPDGLFHATRVEVRRKGVRVRCKEGFLWLTGAQEQERELFSAYLAPDLYHAFPLAMEALSYLEGGERPAVEFAIAVPDQTLLLLPVGDGFTAHLEAGVALRAGESRIVDHFSRRVEARLSRKEMATHGLLTLVARREIPPGDYEAVAVVRDLGTGNIGALRQRVRVPALSRERIAMSSLVLESAEERVRRVDLDSGTEGDGGPAVPTAFRIFPRGAEIRASCFIYHPSRRDGTGNAEFEVRGVIRKGVETARQFPPAVHIFTPDQKVDAIPVKIPVSLGDLEPGTYSLQIQVVDRVAGEGVFQSVDFMVR